MSTILRRSSNRETPPFFLARGEREKCVAAQKTADNSARRKVHLGAAILSLSALADSAVEHYRGALHNRAMFAPFVAASLSIADNLACALRPDRRSSGGVHALAAATGLAGFGFHVYNIMKRPGGFSWLNLFYGAPVGAPFALTLAGILGRGAQGLKASPAASRMRAGRALAALSAAGLAGTVAEAGLLHFRGAFHDPAMILPVSLPPVSAALLGAAALAPDRRKNRNARAALEITALLGFIGVAFHAYGVSRNMGGWRNWSQNILNGPPLPAPPSFTGLALAGLAALSLLEPDDG